MVDQTSFKIDRIDLKIMQLLQQNGRITNQALASQVALSPSSCLQRVRRLEEQGFITGYRAELNLHKVARHITCIATVALKNHTQNDFRAFEALVAELPEVVECLTVSGEFDFLLKVICPDMQRYLAINDQLVSAVDFQLTINTYVVMSETKQRQGVDLTALQAE